MNIVPDYFIYKIALVGKDDKKYGEGVHRHVDVFIVLEQNKYGVDKYSVGGITKANRERLITKQESVLLKKIKTVQSHMMFQNTRLLKKRFP